MAAPAVAMDADPRVITLVGRGKDRENQDLQGEYHRISAPALVHGRPAYRKPGARTVIRYWSPTDRWIIDREGLQESDACSAYAEQGGAQHPAREDLVWRVWESQHQQHLRDPELVATAAPPALQVLGAASRPTEHAELRGEYRLVGLHQGRVAYRKVGAAGGPCLRYWPAADRWLLDEAGLRNESEACSAYAEARGALSPGAPGLVWYVRDAARGCYVADGGLVATVAPAVVELLGREASKENVIMNGSYHLLGLHTGRPAFGKADGSGHVIRYWPKEDRWLVDFDGLQDRDVCNAYAEAQGSRDHPVDSSIVWHVWESTKGKHLTDRTVRALSAPQWVRISGREPGKENAAINGDYVLVTVVEGKAAYKKKGTNHVIRYWLAEDRWIVDLESGFDGGDVANAYADAKGADNPGSGVLVWHVWETAKGRHAVDSEVLAEGLRHAAIDPVQLAALVSARPGCQSGAGAATTTTAPAAAVQGGG
mmetsp:Transcript_126435/g.404818  ORF Transcript_126435/g.404818 Transcript_126435/m.404818 type:complete len:483 (-) Transcript_126435:126-1574(-)